jgi:hypothetical protein
MKKSYLAALVAGSTLALCVAMPASATVMNWSLTGTDLSASGQFTVSSVANGDGSHTVTGVTGTQTVGLITSAITGLSSYAAADQELFTLLPYVDLAGISFSTMGLGDFNIFSNGGNFELSSTIDSVGYPGNGSPVTFEVTDVAPGVPEPATWAMMLMGFGLIGATLRDGRRSLVTAT